MKLKRIEGLHSWKHVSVADTMYMHAHFLLNVHVCVQVFMLML